MLSCGKKRSEVNLLDGILIVVIATSSFYGLFKGLVKEVLSLLALIVGLIGAGRFYETASPLLAGLGFGTQAATILSFILLFTLIFIGVILIGRLLHQLVHAASLGWLNRLGGAAFGFLRGAIVTCVIVLILISVLSERAPLLTGSSMTPPILRMSGVLFSWLPDDLQRWILDKEKKLRQFHGNK